MNLNRIYDTEGGMAGSSGRDFDKLLGKLSVPKGKPKEQLWNTILENIEKEQRVKVVSITSILLKVAASLLILATISGAVWIWGFGNVAVYAPKGQHLSLVLPDGSQVRLNADSKILYNKALWNIKRKVSLSGEALFKVKKGSRFDVVTTLTTTSVLGTTFDVYERDGKVKVSCIEGKVQVTTHNTNSKVILTAGLFTETSQKKLIAPINKDVNESAGWSKGEFFFNNTPLSEVLKEIERQFNVEVICNESENRFYTGYFSNSDLNNALRLVCIPMEMSYSVNNNIITIRTKSTK